MGNTAGWRGTKGGERIGDICNGVNNKNKSKSEKKLFLNSHGDVKFSIGNIVNNIVITMYGARWVLELSRGSLCILYH